MKRKTHKEFMEEIKKKTSLRYKKTKKFFQNEDPKRST